jgi:hypothetical protein
MTRLLTSTFVVLALCALSATPGARTIGIYDRSAETTISGTINAVVSYPSMNGTFGVHLELKTPNGVVNVHVAPAMFIGENNVSFTTGETITVVGAKIVANKGKTTFVVARTITRGATTLNLRNEEGAPLWTPADDGIDGCGVTHMAQVG